MPFPAVTLINTTATGDVVMAPGAPTVLVKGIPSACIGDAVAGPVCTGVITGTLSPNKIAMGRPIACLTSPVSGVNPITGIPIATVLAITPNINDIV